MKRSLLTALVALSLSAPVVAADYYVVVPMPGKVAGATPAPDPVENITVSLNAYALPVGTVNTAYSFNLNSVLDVQGDSAFNADNVAWSVVAGEPPEGIALQADGTLSGLPTVKNEAGASFEVKASYKGKDGQQVYTIVVNGVELQVTQISAGGSHTCAVTTSGAAKCWGRNSSGQFGNGDTSDSATPVSVTGLDADVVQISAGYLHTCAVTTAGAAKCWGYNVQGQLGNGSTTPSNTPVAVTGLGSGVTQIAAGGLHTCALHAGAAKCWGYNVNGQLGNGSTSYSATPVSVTGLGSGVTQIAAGDAHTCAVHAGAAKCWGAGGSGRLGNGSTTQSNTPVAVTGLDFDVMQIAAGDAHTCAVHDGAAKCWGNGSNGRLGNGSTSYSATPVSVTGLASNVTQIAAGPSHTCAVHDGAAKCWGYNVNGQLGNGSTTQSNTPVAVTGLDFDVMQISAGYHHTCAVHDGAAKCWGLGSSGQLGNGGTTKSTTPVDVQF